MIFGNSYLFKKTNNSDIVNLTKGTSFELVETITTTEENVIFRDLDFGTNYTIFLNGSKKESFTIDVKEIILTKVIPFITDENIKKEFTDFITTSAREDFYSMLNKIVKTSRNFNNLSYVLDLKFEEEIFDSSVASVIKNYLTMTLNYLQNNKFPTFAGQLSGNNLNIIKHDSSPIPLGEKYNIKTKRRVILNGIF